MSKVSLFQWCKQNGNYGEKLINEFSNKNQYTIDDISYGNSTIKILWNCQKCNGKWYAKANSRTSTNRKGCPYCSGRKVLLGYNDLETNFPELCSEWDFKSNDKKPSEYTPGSNKIVWWICKNCKSSYKMSILSRTCSQKQGCPYCAGKKIKTGHNDLQSQFPNIAKEFDIKNNHITPDKVFCKSSKYYYWICSTCGNNYRMQVNTRTSAHQSCPKCANRFQTSFPEQAILYYLKKYNLNAESRVKIDGNELDIFIPNKNIGIEYDGMYYHKNLQNREHKKNEIMKNNNIFLIRVKESNLKTQITYKDKDLMIINYKYINSTYKNIGDIILIILQYINHNIKKFNIDISKDMSKILAYKNTEIQNNLLIKRPDLAEEWDYNKNHTKPEYHTYKSNDIVWWICKKCHYNWKSTIANRVEHNNGCPKCSKVLKSNNYRLTIAKKTSSIINKYPTLKKNISVKNKIDINLLTIGSADFIIWICTNCKKEFNNHEIRTMIKKYEKYGIILCDDCMKKL